jgi:hypothetical protein
MAEWVRQGLGATGGRQDWTAVLVGSNHWDS